MMSFSKEEIRDIVISIIVVSIVFSYPNFNLFGFFLIVVVTAFLFHELAHRYVARKFGCVAEYRIWLQGLLIGLVFMFLGFKFVAPGAVMIQPYRFGRWGFSRSHLTSKELGLIAFSGPITNLIIAIIFSTILLPVDSYFLDATGGYLSIAYINAWLAMFNLLPIPPLDGSKIFTWKPWLWLLLLLGSILLSWPYLSVMLGI